MATLGYGSQFQRHNGSSYVNVAQVTSISGPSMKADAIDVTSMDSADAHREFIAGLRDAGDVKVEANYDPTHATHLGLLTDFQAGTVRSYKLIEPTNAGSLTWTFTAVITAFETSNPIDNKIPLSVTLKVSGKAPLA